MNKRVALLVTIFLIFPYIVYSITTFVVQETEKISLQTNATDPDSDKLIITYSSPLNENGEWQTDYGDAGEYTVTITASDGVTSASEEALIIVNKKEESPKIESFTPEQDTLSINEAESISFSIAATDINKDELSYEWFLDDDKVKEGIEFSYEPGYDSSGEHQIHVVVSDGTTEVSKEWHVKVENVDVESLLEGINDITVNENEVARLELPDFEKYGLAYTISEPLGNKNEWQTGYEDAGSYYINVHAEGKGFDKDKIVKVVVNDVDRPPIFERIGNKAINENEELVIALSAKDPDGDEIAYSAKNLPEGAIFNGSVFTWKPDYDTVRKEGFIDAVMDKFRVLGKSFYIQFATASKDKEVVQNVIITVKDVNRVPVLEDFEPITISEGEILKIVPNAYDPDGDKVRLRFSGFISSDTYTASFDDAGSYYVKVTASDGLLETTKFVQINITQTNREPIFGKIQDIKAREGDNIALLLDAHDPDGDEISYSLDNPPEGSSLKGNAFLWTPGFNTASRSETKKLDIVFVVSDGKAETRQIATVEVADKNRAPKITDATKSIVAKANEPVIMSVNAVDEDNDELTYTWDFGFFEKYKATAIHQRIFTSRGAKTVKVAVSDGIDEVEHTINVNVV